MKKTLLLSIFYLLFLFSCSDSEDVGGKPTIKEEVKKELTAITDKLEAKENLTQFAEVLKNTDLDVATAKLTILAAQDTRAQKSGDNETINKENIKRHIIEGVYDFLNMDKDSLTLKSVDGTKIYVFKIDKDVYVNGVKMVST